VVLPVVVWPGGSDYETRRKELRPRPVAARSDVPELVDVLCCRGTLSRERRSACYRVKGMLLFRVVVSDVGVLNQINLRVEDA
jgi:hypothetical protein